MNYYEVITICGSVKFKKEMEEIIIKLTNEFKLVLPLANRGTENHIITESELLIMHKQKIDMSDSIFVVNIGGYIGESTKKEISHALSKGKNVYWLEPITELINY